MSDHTTTVDVMNEAYAIAKRRDGLTQVQLAERMGVKQQTISNWLKGTRTPSIDDYLRFLRACHAPKRLYSALADVTRLFPFSIPDLLEHDAQAA